MSLQMLYNQLLELRLPAFCQALREQQSNPRYAELTFEDRLALLVDRAFKRIGLAERTGRGGFQTWFLACTENTLYRGTQINVRYQP